MNLMHTSVARTLEKDCWILKTVKEAFCPDISLREVFDAGICIVGRSHLQNCSNCQFISNQHCSFRLHPGGLVFKALTKFDVIFVNGVLLKSGEEVVVKDDTKITLCQKFFKYRLFKLTPSADVENCILREHNESEDVTRTLTLNYSDVNCSLDFTTECDNIREGIHMSLADIESTVCMRSHTALTVTKALCRTLLSSFHCDICLEVIASCRSCVPCGHSFCSSCIQHVIDSAAAGGRGAKCPHCRTNITHVVPNKTVDAAVSDCLTNIKDASSTCAALRMSAEVSESQDISAWTKRYEVNEAPNRAAPVAAAAVAPVARRDYFDTHGEDVAEDVNGDGEYLSCDNALVEFARSGVSVCIQCHAGIAQGELRFGITQITQNRRQFTRFIHMTCGDAFNSLRGPRQSKIRVESLQGMENFNQNTQQEIRRSIPVRL